MRSRTAALMLATGCIYVAPAWKDEATCDIYACPRALCEVTLRLDMADIEACYHDPESLPEILEECADEWETNTQCNLTFPNLLATKDGSPVDVLIAGDAEAICDALPDDWILYWDDATQPLSSLGYIREDINDDCTISEVSAESLNCAEVEEDAEYVSPCPTASARLSAPPGAEYELFIDPALSYVDVDIGTESVFAELHGNAFAATSPNQFLVAFARSDDFEYEDDDFTENHAALTAPIYINASSGTYTVPVSQDFMLVFQGLREDVEYAAGVEPNASSGGVFDVPNGEWDYHYSQSGSGTSVVLHLEGELVGLSP